jgi:protein TonB
MAQVLHLPRVARRGPLLALIVLGHAVLVYYVNAGLRIELPVLIPDLQFVDIAPEPKAPAEPLKAPADPRIEPTEIEAVPLDVAPIDIAPEDAPAIEAIAVDVPDAGGAVADTSPALDPRRPIGKPAYPPQSVRMGEEGLVRVHACVQPDGRLTGVALAAGSGYPLLDAAAVKHLSRPGVRLRPGTRNGVPVAMCTAVPIRFDIANR